VPQHPGFDRIPDVWRELLLVDAALGTGLIDALGDGRPRGAQELASSLGLDEQAVDIALIGLDDLGYVAEGTGGWTLTDGARGMLVDADDHRYRRHSFEHSAHQVRRWVHLPQVLRDGGPAPAGAEPRDIGRFMMAMDDASRRSAPDVVDVLLAAVPDAKSILDLGGGPATYAREIARRGVRTAVFDIGEVVEVMRPRLAGEPLVEYVAGDMNEALPPGTHDVVLIANVLHIQSAATNEALIRRAADAVRPGGVLAVFDMFLGRSQRAPLFSVNMLVSTGQGRCYREEELRGWCEAAGLTVESVTDFPERGEQLLIARR
jgi:2-polyprenyl-3-methyl-5-hydroxy-6-metoxy-1,4-benzoquinol methylase